METFLKVKGIILFVIGVLTIVVTLILLNGGRNLSLPDAEVTANSIIGAGIICKLLGIILIALSIRIKKRRTQRQHCR